MKPKVCKRNILFLVLLAILYNLFELYQCRKEQGNHNGSVLNQVDYEQDRECRTPLPIYPAEADYAKTGNFIIKNP